MGDYHMLQKSPPATCLRPTPTPNRIDREKCKYSQIASIYSATRYCSSNRRLQRETECVRYRSKKARRHHRGKEEGWSGLQEQLTIWPTKLFHQAHRPTSLVLAYLYLDVCQLWTWSRPFEKVKKVFFVLCQEISPVGWWIKTDLK
jgi:hypothetical protein